MPTIHSRRQRRKPFSRVLVALRLLLINVSKSLAFSVAVGRHGPFQAITTHHNLDVSLHGSTNNENDKSNSISINNTGKKVTGITLKIAIDSVTGGVADLAEEKSDRFTCPEALDMVHRLRRDCDAVLVGRGTVVADNPSLTVRRGITSDDAESDTSHNNGDGESSRMSENLHPLRVILDPGLSLLLDRFQEGRFYQVFQDGFRTVVYHCVRDVDEDSLNLLDSVTLVQLSPFEIIKPLFSDNNKDNDDELSPLSTEDQIATTTETITSTLEEVAPMTSIQMSVEKVWLDLSRRFHVKHLMVEGGPTTARSFLEAGLVDRVILVQANVGFRKPLLSNLSNETFLEAGLELQGTDSLGVDHVEYWTRPNTPWPSVKLNEWP
jgi:diaminohydroxyphosphoribosylaminopyrimidine deaminase / 5-amino-6-(5-phosphoribosylamino)uracil reductase